MLYLLGLPSEGRNLPARQGGRRPSPARAMPRPLPRSVRAREPSGPPLLAPAPVVRSRAKPGPARRGCSERGPPGGQQAARGEPGVGADGCGSLCRTTSLRRSSAGGPRPSRALDAPSTSSKRGRAGRGACGGLSARPRPGRGSGRRGLARGPKAAK